MTSVNKRSSGGKPRFGQLQKSVVAAVTGVALALGSITVAPLAEAQTNVQPVHPDNSRSWDPSIPFAPGADIVANPQLEDKCGLDIALVFDLSTSIKQQGLDGSKKAGKAVVEALNNTPTRIGIYNFGTVAPASGNEQAQLGRQERGSKAALDNAIDKLNLPSSGIVGTNWDRGLSQIPRDTYDVVYFITDGLPTAFGDAAGSGDLYRGLYNRPIYNHVDNGKVQKDFAAAQADVQRAVASANALKANTGKGKATRIVPLAVGDAVNGPVAQTYLDYISGPGDSIPVTDYEKLANELVETATKGCQGEVIIQKAFAGNVKEEALKDWKFEASNPSDGFQLLNSTAVTDSKGRARFGYLAPGPEAKGSFTITETGAKFMNVTCTLESGESLPRDGNSFTVPAGYRRSVNCTVTNPAPCPVCTPTTVTTTVPTTVTTQVPTTVTSTVTTAVPTTVKETSVVTTTVNGTPTTITETKEIPTTITSAVPTTVTTAVPTTVTTQVPTTVTSTVTTAVPTTVKETSVVTTTVNGTPTTITETKEIPTTITSAVPTTITEKVTTVKEVPTTVTTAVPTTITTEVPTTVTTAVPTTVTTQVPTTVTLTSPPTTITTTVPTTIVAEVPTTVTKTVPTTVTTGIPTTITTVVPTTIISEVTKTESVPTTVTKTEVRGGSSTGGVVDERCVPATVALSIPLLALIPIGLLQQVSIPGVDAFMAEINGRIAEANNRVQQGLGIFDENTARAIAEWNARIGRFQAENQQVLQAAGVLVAALGVASYLAYFCIPRSDLEPTSSS